MTTARLFKRLSAAGFRPAGVRALLPSWWDEHAENSPTAVFELSLRIAARLGLDPRSLLNDAAVPKPMLVGERKFKGGHHLEGAEADAISAFGQAVASPIFAATDDLHLELPSNPLELRQALLGSGASWVSLAGLIATCWALGVPVCALALLPARVKQMSAMTVRIGDRHAILITRHERNPSWLAFVIAHEIAHVALKHLKPQSTIIDWTLLGKREDGSDEEETQADNYALTLLAGVPNLEVKRRGAGWSPSEAASEAVRIGGALGIDPGHILLKFAFESGEWALARRALRRLIPAQVDAVKEINAVAAQFIDWQRISDEQADYLRAVLAVR